MMAEHAPVVMTLVAAVVLEQLYMAFALPVARLLVRGWHYGYTALAAPDDRAERRLEMASDAHEYLADQLSEGYKPGQAALLLLGHVLLGAWADIVWTAAHARMPRRPVLRPMRSVRVCAVSVSGLLLGLSEARLLLSPGGWDTALSVVPVLSGLAAGAVNRAMLRRDTRALTRAAQDAVRGRERRTIGARDDTD
jgi:hypothetical protein